MHAWALWVQIVPYLTPNVQDSYWGFNWRVVQILWLPYVACFVLWHHFPQWFALFLVSCCEAETPCSVLAWQNVHCFVAMGHADVFPICWGSTVGQCLSLSFYTLFLALLFIIFYKQGHPNVCVEHFPLWRSTRSICSLNLESKCCCNSC